MNAVIKKLRDNGIQPTPQRIAVAEVVLESEDHPTADEIWMKVRELSPTVSRATVYNTLNLFTEKGLVRQQVLKEGTVVFDPHVAKHHHFIDEETGQIFDVPWEAVKVTPPSSLGKYEIKEYHVILRGKIKKNKTTKK